MARYTGTTVTTELEAQSNNNTPASGGGNSTQNSNPTTNYLGVKHWSNSKVTDNTCVIGDSWAEGIAPYFATGDTASGKQLWYIMQHCVPQNFLHQRYVLYCGLNDIIDPYHREVIKDHKGRPAVSYPAFTESLIDLCSRFDNYTNRQKHLYVCTFPRLKFPSGYNACITQQRLNNLNQAIISTVRTTVSSYNNTHVIIVPDEISTNNLDNSGYHLKSYKTLAQYINSKFT